MVNNLTFGYHYPHFVFHTFGQYSQIMIRALIGFAAAVLLQSCMLLAGPLAEDQADKHLTAGNNAIPVGIGRGNTYVVAVLQGRESRDKYVRKYFKENYNGKYVFASIEELQTDYADVDTYRYAFTYSKLDKTHIDSLANSSTLPSSNYFIYDRKEKREYNSGFSSSMFGKVIDAYTRNMEQQRLANAVER